MNKKWFFVTVCILLVSMSLFAQDTNKWSVGGFVDYKGRDWLTWSPQQKNAYLVGFCTGSTAGLMYFAYRVESDEYLKEYLQSFVKQLYLGEIKSKIQNITINNIIELQATIDFLLIQVPDMQNMYVWQIIYLLTNKEFYGQ